MNCYRREGSFPGACIGESVSKAQIESMKKLYQNDPLVSKMALSAAEIEGTYYGKLTRVEEIIAFARRIGAEKLGIASCIGLMSETRTFVKILEAHGLNSFCSICKVGSIDKTEIGIKDEMKVQKGSYEAICNPVLQAKLLNREKTGLNVIVGLCVGHDSLFIKYSKAPVTTLITKDRVLGHNPAAALYTAGFYYKKLLSDQDI
jgi:uncharacterized metal-binding protein